MYFLVMIFANTIQKHYVEQKQAENIKRKGGTTTNRTWVPKMWEGKNSHVTSVCLQIIAEFRN